MLKEPFSMLTSMPSICLMQKLCHSPKWKALPLISELPAIRIPWSKLSIAKCNYGGRLAMFHAPGFKHLLIDIRLWKIGLHHHLLVSEHGFLIKLP
jgi:hypothetical protein